MKEMTARERILRTVRHEEADRMPMVDSAWRGTIHRWENEGMPSGIDWQDHFGFDKKVTIQPDNSPRYPIRVLEQNERYQIVTTKWGITQKQFFELDSTPEVLDCYYSTKERWEEAKELMLKDCEDRIPWQYLKENYPRWKAEGQFLELLLWFGFDVAHSHMAGTENILVGMIDDPEWIRDIFDTYLSIAIRLSEKILDAGYEFDGMRWYDDMGYKGTTFFSPKTYRELLLPFHKRAVDWAHERGLVAELHSCGYIEPLIPDILTTGVDILNPLEIKAGMDPLRLKEQYGNRLAFHGGMNAQIFDDFEKIEPMMREFIPRLKEGSGYIFASDHSIPNSVSYETMKKISALAKELGKNES